MTRLEPFDGKRTRHLGLWYDKQLHRFQSQAINISELRKFKGVIRLQVMKNMFYEGGKNGRPNYLFTIIDSRLPEEQAQLAEIQEGRNPYRKNGDYYTEDGERLYTRDEVRRVIDGTVRDVHYGFHDPGDILIEDFVR